MRLLRPYIPYSVRVHVAARQVVEAGLTWCTNAELDALPDTRKLRALLLILFCGEKVHLDHDPALENRVAVRNKAGLVVGYIPDANNPDFLIYRLVEGHRIKTYVRGDGALRSDVSQRRYLKRVAENHAKKKTPKRKIAQRKNFTWPKRPFSKRG